MAELSYPQTETAQTVFRTDSSTHIIVLSDQGEQIGTIQEIRSYIEFVSAFQFVLNLEKIFDIFNSPVMMKTQRMPFRIEVRRVKDGHLLEAFRYCWLTEEIDIFISTDDHIIYNSAKILAEKEGA